MVAKRAFRLDEWSIIPGPASILPPFDSQDIQEIAAYSPSSVAAVVLDLDGAELALFDGTDWWTWSARWSCGSDYIDLEMTLLDEPEISWGGFGVSGTGSATQLLKLYDLFKIDIDTAWLHDSECGLYTSQTFAAEFNLPENLGGVETPSWEG